MYKKVLIASIGFGSGHNRAASAVSEYIPLQFSGAEVRVIDFLNHKKNLWDRLTGIIYFSAIKTIPAAYHFSYRKLSSSRWLRPILFKPYLKKMENFLKEYPADLIISTHVFCAMASLELKEKDIGIKAVWGLLTDFMDDAYWNTCHLDRFFVATDELKQRLIKKGIEEKRIETASLPVKKEFHLAGDRAAICRKIDPRLNPDGFTVLVLGGGDGYGNIKAAVKIILDLQVQCIVVTGTNKRLKRRLEIMGQRSPLFVFGYVDNIHELMDISDVCITKPGGMTIAECLAKNLPMIIWGRTLPGPETENISFLTKNNLAERCISLPSLRKTIVKEMER
jgi:processive 1,2-diacylglycerol beta-glucosyltransferase